MFIYYHNNKPCSAKKGQIVPIFIVVLVVLIILAMVTVNIGKISFTKTESANSADAGGLAAGSVMANVFNGVAIASSQMEASYWEFLATISVSFVISYIYLTRALIKATAAETSATSAEALACPFPCAALVPTAAAIAAVALAIEAMTNFRLALVCIMIMDIAFTIGQHYFYQIIRDMAEEGRESAIELGHKFSFMNSGIGSKLKNEQQDAYSDFVDGLGSATEYTYSWRDGQARNHSVKSQILIDPVDTFDLKVALLPFPIEVALFVVALVLTYKTITSLTTALTSYSAALGYLMAACACMGPCLACCNPLCPWGCPCCAIWAAMCASAMTALGAGLTANGTAIGLMVALYPVMAVAWAGLLPGPTITDSGGRAGLMYTICWVDDIVHNRKVKADSWQNHEGADLGLWQTEYPQVHSFSIVDFTGLGSIHPAEPRFDASVVATDKLGAVGALPPVDPERSCRYATSRRTSLQNQINSTLDSAQSFEESAAQVEAEARILLLDPATAAEANQMLTGAAGLRQKAQESREDAADLETELQDLENLFSYCFGAGN